MGKKCSYCKTDNPIEANFCRHCGHEFPDSRYKVPGTVKEVIKYVPKEKIVEKVVYRYKKNPVNRWLVIICIGLLAYIGYNAFANEQSPTLDGVQNQDSTSVNEIDTTVVENEQETAKTVIPHDFVFVEAGTLKHYKYDMDDNCNNLYKNVDLDAFYICKHEVTQEEYEKVMGNNPSKMKGSKLPVNCITFADAIRYCNERSKQEGYNGFYTIENNVAKIKSDGNGYRLPNEYEWAFASRAKDGTKSKYPGGNNIGSIAWYGGNSKRTPHPVQAKQPNARGLYDMNGNVSEYLWAKASFGPYNCMIGSDFSSYIGFEESDVYGAGYYSETNGMRLVLVPSDVNNNNLSSCKTQKLYKVNYYRVEFD